MLVCYVYILDNPYSVAPRGNAILDIRERPLRITGNRKFAYLYHDGVFYHLACFSVVVSALIDYVRGDDIDGSLPHVREINDSSVLRNPKISRQYSR